LLPAASARHFVRVRAVPTRRNPERNRRRLPHSSCKPVPANNRCYRKMRKFLLFNQSLKMHKLCRKRRGYRMRRSAAIVRYRSLPRCCGRRSRVTRACCCALTPKASNSLRCSPFFSRHVWITCSAASHHVCGSCSRRPRGKPSIKACVALACAITFRNRYRLKACCPAIEAKAQHCRI
jgi:hypothetical protein